MARRVLFDALAARYGGGAYAAVQLARHLVARPEVSRLVVVTRRGSIVERGLADDPVVECRALAPAAHVELIRRTAWEAVRLPRLVGREQCDVVMTMSGLLRGAAGRPLICLLGNPVMYERQTPANLLRRWAVDRTVRRAAYTAAPSRLMADLVADSSGRSCAVLPWGVDHGVFSPAARAGEEILCVADFYAHKRHDLVIDAWLRLREPRPVLRLLGNPAADPHTHARLLARIASLPDAESIALEYNVPLHRLVAAYRGARVFVMASEHESFCMPLAESMACGVPGVVRGLGSLRETGGEGAAYVDGDDPSRWAAAIERLLADDREHDRARERAVDTAAGFSWETCSAALAGHL
jgi:glycosyltransferase involved in cell wall biosynthesis